MTKEVKGREEEQILLLEAGNWRSCRDTAINLEEPPLELEKKTWFKVHQANGEEVRNLGDIYG
eukprot:10348826-Ditylum_brightwellii.AAC.1